MKLDKPKSKTIYNKTYVHDSRTEKMPQEQNQVWDSYLLPDSLFHVNQECSSQLSQMESCPLLQEKGGVSHCVSTQHHF